jgi:hypothetical protein
MCHIRRTLEAEAEDSDLNHTTYKYNTDSFLPKEPMDQSAIFEQRKPFSWLTLTVIGLHIWYT